MEPDTGMEWNFRHLIMQIATIWWMLTVCNAHTGLRALHKSFPVNSVLSYQAHRLIIPILQLRKWRSREVITSQAHTAVQPVVQVRSDLRDQAGLTLCSGAPGTTVEARASQKGKAREKGSYLLHFSPFSWQAE